jgi:hypothetical protein
MKRKTLGVLVLSAALLFGACRENPVIDLNITDKKAEERIVPDNSSGQGIEGMEPFDIAVFNTERSAWEAEHPEPYNFIQWHRRYSWLYSCGPITVVNDIPDKVVLLLPWPVPLDENGNLWTPLLLCSTISDLYEKINALWIDHGNTGASFLIKYSGQFHYPTDILLKNINDSGDNYQAYFTIQLPDNDGGGYWGGVVVR